MDMNALMEKIHQGDKAAFRQFYSQCNRTVYRTALRETGDESMALEVVKAVFQEIYSTVRANGLQREDVYRWLDELTIKHIRLRHAPASEHLPPHRYTEEEAEAIMQSAEARAPTEENTEQKPKRAGGTLAGIVATGALALALAWVLVGMLGTIGVLPKLELGYAWFNATLFPLF